jgi:DNA-directed RNA polymerase specialized sigma24 family protein
LLIGAEIARLVDGLEPELRAVMKASMSGETIEEISESLRIPKGTCNSRLRRAREQIKAALARNDAFSPAFRKQSYA